MSGLWHNLLTLLVACFKRDSGVLQFGCSCTFWVTPFDVGISILESDSYLQLAESAQLDFAVRSDLLGRMWQARCAMVNSEQQIQFTQPIKLFNKVCVKTTIVLQTRNLYIFNTPTPFVALLVQALQSRPNSNQGASLNLPLN